MIFPLDAFIVHGSYAWYLKNSSNTYRDVDLITTSAVDFNRLDTPLLPSGYRKKLNNFSITFVPEELVFAYLHETPFLAFSLSYLNADSILYDVDKQAAVNSMFSPYFSKQRFLNLLIKYSDVFAVDESLWEEACFQREDTYLHDFKMLHDFYMQPDKWLRLK